MPGPDDGDHVEPGGGRLRTPEGRKIHRSGAGDASLLAGIHRLSGRKKGGAGAVADLDEDEVVAVSHDEVDFSASAAKISADETKSTALEIAECAPLCERA